MKIIILLIILFLLINSLLFIKKVRKTDAVVLIPIISSFIFLPIIGALISDITTLDNTIDNFKEKYQVTNYLLKTYDYEEDNNSLILCSIVDKVKEINETIEKNKKFSDNIFLKDFYSKEIANTELITFDLNNLIKNNLYGKH